jgi:hypothetical protein
MSVLPIILMSSTLAASRSWLYHAAVPDLDGDPALDQ